MLDLVQWLRAQLDEDERIAREASGSTVVGEPGNWNPSPGGDEWEAFEGDVEEELLVALRPRLPRPPDVMSGMWGAWASNDPDPADVGAGSSMPAFRHAARHDPARVLREIEAKRRLLDLHRRVTKRSTGSGGGTVEDCARCDQFPAQYPCATVRLLALPYADRPGYREEWRP